MTLLQHLFNAQIAGAAVFPTAAYTGPLPNGIVKKGSRGADARAVQQFLNWCIKAGLATDSYCGSKTVAAIKRYQKQYSLKVDGVFGNQCKAKAKTIIAKYAPKPSTAPAQNPTWADKAITWAKKIAADDSWHYVKYTKDTRTHECPICRKHPVGPTHGWNCIGFSYSCLAHGAGINMYHGPGVINNARAEKILAQPSDAAATKLVRQSLNNNNFVCIKRAAGMPQSLLKPGDVCLYFKGKKYIHTFFYIGGGQMIDCTSGKSQISQRKALTPKVVIRYTGG